MLIFLLTVLLLKRHIKNAAMARVIIFFVYGLLCVQSLVAQSSKQISSPDGKLQFVFDLSNEGAPVYSISYDQKAVILSSSLGLNGWERGSALSDVSVSKQDTVWKPVYGERSQVRDHYQGMIITLQRNNDENLKLQIVN